VGVGSGRVFQNFPDPELQDWAGAYDGPNYHRLVRVKARYDPAGFFRFPQSLPAPAPSTADLRHDRTACASAGRRRGLVAARGRRPGQPYPNDPVTTSPARS
jgi:hypothetical protein